MVYASYQDPSRNDSVSVGVTNVSVSEARNSDNPRKVILLRNISPNATDIISLSFGPNQAVANTGIILRQFESVVDAQDGAYVPWQGTIQAICATATGVLSVHER